MKKELYIKPIDGFPVNSLKDLIDSLYRDVHTVNRRFYARPTYHDKTCIDLEGTGVRRSFEDLWTLAKTYYPKTTEKDLMAVLKELDINVRYCGDICKFVFSFELGVHKLTKETFNLYVEHDHYFLPETYQPKELIEIYEQL